MITVETYTYNDDLSRFYSLMGRFFAEQKYKKELPYLSNNEKKLWKLYFIDNELAGFYSLQNTKSNTLLSDIYVIEKFKNTELLDDMLLEIISENNSIKTITNSETFIKKLLSLKFVKVGNKGSYGIYELKE